jgi:hypothetical protein
MFKFFPLVIIASLFFVLTSCDSKPDDKKIQDSVTKQLLENKNYAGISASVTGGIVTLTGTCDGPNCAVNAETNIKDIDGVKKVVNSVVKDNSTDLTMRTSVQSFITKYPDVQADVSAGVITLRGSIDRANLQSLMSDLTTLHPAKIDNQLVVK